MSGLTVIQPDRSHKALVALTLAVFPSIIWRHHGIGVLQGYVLENTDPEMRLHIWDPELVKRGIVGNGDVHDHRFDMISHVLAGKVLHEEWIVCEDDEGEYASTLLTHARAAADTKFHGPTTTTEDRFSAVQNMYAIEAGWLYKFRAKTFHRSPVGETSVTLVEKHNQRSEAARILHPRDLPFIPAFGHDENPDVLCRVFDRAKEALGKAFHQ